MLEQMREIIESFIPFNKFLGIRAVAIGKGFARLELPFREEFVGDPSKPALHGGVISALADAAGGGAVWAAVFDPKVRVSTIDIRVDYLRPGRLEDVVAEATVVRAGSHIGVVDINVFHGDSSREPIATAKGVYYVRTVKPRFGE